MSGFVGILNRDGGPVSRGLLGQMAGQLAFRGPDELSVWQEGQIGMGFALLHSTRDASREAGPSSLDGNTWITADARLDARSELVQVLHNAGQDIHKETPDSDLILHAYHIWGEACLEKLAGDFAFAIWDRARQTLLCARDQFGAVPFYYAQSGDVLVFGNTLAAVRAYPGTSDRLNDLAVVDYLCRALTPDTEATMFSDVRQLPAGHSLGWKAGRSGLEQRRYWHLPVPDGFLEYPDPKDYAHHYLDLLRQATDDRLRTDRVAVAMSGGLDSPALAVLAQQLLSAASVDFHLEAYTLDYGWVIPHEEVHYARMVADANSISMRVINECEYLRASHVEPPAWLPPTPDGDVWPASGLSRMCQAMLGSQTQVLLSGIGGDPLLKPGSSYFPTLLKRGQLLRFLSDQVRMARSEWRWHPRLGLRRRLARLRGRSPNRIPFPNWLNPGLVSDLDLQNRWLQQQWKVYKWDARERMVYDPAWADILVHWDAEAWHLPVKVRFPFCDLRILDFVRRVPAVPWFQDKTLLREAGRGLLPEPVRARPKSPLKEDPWRAYCLKHGLPVWLKELVDNPLLRPYVDQDAFRRLLQTLTQPGTASSAYQATKRVARLALWLQAYETQRRAHLTLEG